MALATRCPHCQTVFRIVPDQLKLHRGLVRCGHCREVFDGVLHQVEVPARATPPSPPPAPPSPPASAAPPVAVEPPTAPASASSDAEHQAHEHPHDERSGLPAAAAAVGLGAAALAAAEAAGAHTHEASTEHEASHEHEAAQEHVASTEHDALNESTSTEHDDRESIEASHATSDEYAIEAAPNAPTPFAEHDLSYPHDVPPAPHDALADEARHALEASHVSADEEQIEGHHDTAAEHAPDAAHAEIADEAEHARHVDDAAEHVANHESIEESAPLAPSADSLGRTEPRLAPDFDEDLPAEPNPFAAASPFDDALAEETTRPRAPATPPEWDPALGELPPGAPTAPFAPDVDFGHDAPDPAHIATPLGATPPAPVFDTPDFDETPHTAEPIGTHALDEAAESTKQHDEAHAAVPDAAHDVTHEDVSHPHAGIAEDAIEGSIVDTPHVTHDALHESEHHAEHLAEHDTHASDDTPHHDVQGGATHEAAASGSVDPESVEGDALAAAAAEEVDAPHDAHARNTRHDDVIDVEPTSSTPNYGANHNDPWAPPADARMEPALAYAATGAAAAGAAAAASSAFAPLSDDTGNDFRIRVEPHDAHDVELHPARRVLGWIVALLLLVLLIAQLAWWQREPIMARWPNTVSAYRNVCAKLGCVVTPPREIDQLQIESSTLTQGTVPNQFDLAMSLHNRAALSLAWPSLEISLLDQSNQLVVRRVVTPGQYLPAGTDVNAGIAPDGHQAVTLRLTATGTSPSNYKVLIFYP